MEILLEVLRSVGEKYKTSDNSRLLLSLSLS